MVTTLELDDIQGLITSGYGKLDAASYLLLRIEDEQAARAWLGRIAEKVRWAAAGVPENEACTQLALTYPALIKLGLCWQALKGFSREFQEGMAGNERRSRALGDLGENAPDGWEWGGPTIEEIDILLLLYAPDDPSLAKLCEHHHSDFRSAGLREIKRLPTLRLTEDREHFGFRDGIAHVNIAGLSHSTDETRFVQAGEFVLGYRNEHGSHTTSPLVDPIEDPAALLPADIGGSDQRDFGRNGSYLVFRQLSQDVQGFETFLQAATRQPDGTSAKDAVERLAAKMVGRWRNGAPLVHFPDKDPGRIDPEKENAFLYHREDPYGMKCPIGAHIRRTNPRDALAPDPGSATSLAVNKRHQLLRRGRTYGAPLDPALAPNGVAPSGASDERGLHFLCFNANISRQFEFVQDTWVNNPNFAGLYAEPDPLIGSRRGADVFTVPSSPVREKVTGIPPFVTVKGGAYFFVPSKRALLYLASDPRRLATAYSAPAAPASQLSLTRGLRIARRLNRWLESLLIFSRRLTRLRNLFDQLFRRPIAAVVQFLIQRSRRDLGLRIAEERELPGETEVTQRITEQMTEFLFSHYRRGVAERAGNTKTYGLVRATFEVADDLDETLRVGIFREPRAFQAWVRLGGPGPLVVPDMKDNGILSIGVKLMGVEGGKLLSDEQSTLDFTGISAPTFTTPNVIENLKLQQHIARGTSVFHFLNPFDSHYLDGIMQGLYAKAHGNPLELRYWSCVPYLFGEGRAIKFSFVPQSQASTQVPRRPSDDYLREAMAKTLASTEVAFDFKIQFQTDPHRMPIEDASVEWPETLSPFVKIATLRIPRQTFDSAAQLAFARNLTYNPWHTIAEHRPLGNQNRARKQIYLETSRVRQSINRESKIEPKGGERFG